MRQTIIVQEDPANETQIINWYRCLGWDLVGNQEVAITTVHGANGNVSSLVSKYVKLMFERDTTHPNYSILDGYYNRCVPLLEEKQKNEKIVKNNGTGKAWAIVSIVAAILGFIIGFAYESSRVSSGFWGHSFDVVAAVLYSIPAFAAVELVGLIIMSAMTKKKYKPRIKETVEKIEQITRESAQYV